MAGGRWSRPGLMGDICEHCWRWWGGGMIALPSLHTLDHAQAARIWLAAETTDTRCGFDRLAERLWAVIGQAKIL